MYKKNEHILKVCFESSPFCDIILQSHDSEPDYIQTSNRSILDQKYVR